MKKTSTEKGQTKPILCALDFDGVLFDSIKFKEDHIKVFARCGISRRGYEETYREAKDLTNGHYVPIKHYALIAKHTPSLSDVLLHEAREASAALVKKSWRYVYGDAKAFLRWCEEYSIALALVSTGDSFQKRKISASGLAPFFKKVIVTKKISKVAGLRTVMRALAHGWMVFVDDKSMVVDDVKKQLPETFVIQMRRHHKQEVSKQVDARVRNFAGVKKIMHVIQTKSTS